jgi:hypothetical protein
VITTVAGKADTGYSGDNGPANLAQLDSPDAVAVDSARNLYIADTQNNRMRPISHMISEKIALVFLSENAKETRLAVVMPSAAWWV